MSASPLSRPPWIERIPVVKDAVLFLTHLSLHVNVTLAAPSVALYCIAAWTQGPPAYPLRQLQPDLATLPCCPENAAVEISGRKDHKQEHPAAQGVGVGQPSGRITLATQKLMSFEQSPDNNIGRVYEYIKQAGEFEASWDRDPIRCEATVTSCLIDPCPSAVRFAGTSHTRARVTNYPPATCVLSVYFLNYVAHRSATIFRFDKSFDGNLEAP